MIIISVVKDIIFNNFSTFDFVVINLVQLFLLYMVLKFGITPWVPRNQVVPFSENIPDLDEAGPEWIPCDEENVDGSITAQQRLSCMAKENQIYVVANMVDYKVVKLSN